MSGNFTLFTNDSGASSNSLSYVQDVFNDVSLPANSNLGLTDSASTNPLGDSFANSDTPRFGIKTLFIKDMYLEEDRSKWVQNKPTYRIIWNENNPNVSGYVVGTPQFIKDNSGNITIDMFYAGDLFGVTSIARRAVFLVQPSITNPSTVTVNVDGAGSTTANPTTLSGTVLADKRSYRAFPVLAEASNETNDLHDFRLISTVQGSVKIVGVQIYNENSGANIEFAPGSTYVNKSKVTTSVGATLAIPSMGSSLGGRTVLYKSSSGTYEASSQAATQLSTIGVGNNASTSLNVTTGTGSSFPMGTIVAGFYGATAYIGAVQSVSTDTLTVTPAIYPASGVSGPLYKLAFGGTNAVIGASLYDLAYSLGTTEFFGVSLGSYVDPYGRFSFMFDYSTSVVPGITAYYGLSTNLVSYPPIGNQYVVNASGASGFIRAEGYFSAADIEISGWTNSGVAMYGGTFYVNGIPTWSTPGISITGTIKFPIFTGAGPGWNSFQWGFGASTGALAISRINLYTNKIPMGISYGKLAYFDTLQSFVDQNNGVVGATLRPWGLWRRVFGSQLPIRTGGSPTLNPNGAQGTMYPISTTSDGIDYAFFGKNICLGGTFNTGTTVKIDGVGIPSASIWGKMYTSLTEGFHTLLVTCAAGSTTLISHIDISRTYDELTNLQTPVDKAAVPTPVKKLASTVQKKNLVYVDQGASFSTSSTSMTDVTGVTLDIQTSGGPVMLMIMGDPAYQGTYLGYTPNGVSLSSIRVGITRNGTSIMDIIQSQTSNITNYSYNNPSVHLMDFPPAGTQRYKVQILSGNAGGTATSDHIRFVAWEI